MDPLIQRTTILPLLIGLALACFGLLPQTQAVSPAPDGGYPGGNTGEGQNALFSLTTGGYNTGNGWNSLHALSSGSFNTGIGAATLFANTASSNTATGAAALFSNTTGVSNTANGAFALLSNTIGHDNTAIGLGALQSNTIGNYNTATGFGALTLNTTGINNAATGVDALHNNTGDNNTATGSEALNNNTTGHDNTASGFGALFFNITGINNTAVGSSALGSNVADYNTAVGSLVLNSNTTGTDNTGVGFSALGMNTGSENTALGAGAGFHLTTGDNNIDIGYNVEGVAGESNTIRIGSTDITTTVIRGISGQTIASGATVLVASNGQLGTMTSSERFKQGIKPMDSASEALLALTPVTFRYKKEIDPAGTSQFGLVAEEVEKVNPELVVRDEDGKPYTVRYDAVNAMLLNEFLKEHKKVEEQQATMTQLKKDFSATIAQLTARLDEQAAQIQKVSAQLAAASPSGGGLEASKPARQVVNNP